MRAVGLAGRVPSRNEHLPLLSFINVTDLSGPTQHLLAYLTNCPAVYRILAGGVVNRVQQEITGQSSRTIGRSSSLCPFTLDQMQDLKVVLWLSGTIQVCAVSGVIRVCTVSAFSP